MALPYRYLQMSSPHPRPSESNLQAWASQQEATHFKVLLEEEICALAHLQAFSEASPASDQSLRGRILGVRRALQMLEDIKGEVADDSVQPA